MQAAFSFPRGIKKNAEAETETEREINKIDIEDDVYDETNPDYIITEDKIREMKEEEEFRGELHKRSLETHQRLLANCNDKDYIERCEEWREKHPCEPAPVVLAKEVDLMGCFERTEHEGWWVRDGFQLLMGWYAYQKRGSKDWYAYQRRDAEDEE